MEPLSDDFQENLDRLIVECLENGCIWGLRDAKEQWATVDWTRLQRYCDALGQAKL